MPDASCEEAAAFMVTISAVSCPTSCVSFGSRRLCLQATNAIAKCAASLVDPLAVKQLPTANATHTVLFARSAAVGKGDEQLTASACACGACPSSSCSTSSLLRTSLVSSHVSTLAMYSAGHGLGKTCCMTQQEHKTGQGRAGQGRAGQGEAYSISELLT